jgi:hypothetical protein
MFFLTQAGMKDRGRGCFGDLSLALALVAIGVMCACGGGSTANTTPPPPPPPPPSFTISVTPQNPSIAPGTTTVLNIGVTPANGFNSSITVILTGLPDGVTSSPASPFMMTTAGLNITLSASSRAVQGTVTLMFQATSGMLNSSASASLLVAPFASFKMGELGGPLVVRDGNSISQLFTTVSGPGATDFSLQFSVSGLPSGVTGTVSPNPAPPNTQMTLTVSASANAPSAQDATITVTAQRASDGMESSSLVFLSVAAQVGDLPNSRTAFVRTDDTPLSIAYDPVHNLIFASALHLNCVDVISPATAQVIKCIPVTGALGVSLSADNTRVLVGTQTSEVAWIDTTLLRVVERDTVPQTPGGGLVIAAQAFQAANGKVLLFSNWGLGDLFGNFQSASAVEWDPAAGTSVPRPDSQGGGLVSMSADHTKMLIGGQGPPVIYNSSTDAFTPVPGIQGVYEPAMNPSGTQFALVDGTPLIQFFDGQMNLIGSTNLTVCCGFRAGGATYSSDGKFLFIVLPNPLALLVTVDATSFQVVGAAPAYYSELAYFSQPHTVGHAWAADATGLVFELADHGVAIDDANYFQNILTAPEALGDMIVDTPDEGPLNTATVTQITTAAFSSIPDVFFGSQRSPNVGLFNGIQVEATAPPSSAVGPVNVKIISPDGRVGEIPQAFTYGSLPITYGEMAAGPQGGATADIFGYGFSVDVPGAPIQVSIGPSIASIKQKSLFPTAVGYPFPLQDLQIGIPSGSPGAQDITITSPAGTAKVPSGFHYLTSLTDYPTVDRYQYLLFDSQRNQVYLSAGDHVDVFSATTHNFSSPITIPSLGGTRLIEGLALTPDGSKLLVANQSDSSMAIINPDNPMVGAVAVTVPPPGQQFNPGPFELAATSTNKVFVTTAINTNSITGSGGSIYQVDLGTMQVSTVSLPFGSFLSINGNFLQGSADGSVVFEATPNDSGGPQLVWRAATNAWQAGGISVQFWDDAAISADGRVLSLSSVAIISDFPFPYLLDPQLNLTAQVNFPEFQAIGNGTGIQLDQTGALLYAPTLAGVDILDTRTGQLRERIFLTEQFPNALKLLAISPDGSQIFLATNTGLTVAELDSVPLDIGSVTPSTGSAGATVTVRGTGFASGTIAKVNNLAATAVFVNSSTLQITLPASLSAGAAQIELTNLDGSSYTLDAAYSVK